MLLAPCGTCCEECPHIEICGGSCHDCKGKPFYLKDFGVDVCPIYDCAVNKKGYRICAECRDLPCQLFYDWKDPSMSEEELARSVNERTAALKSTL